MIHAFDYRRIRRNCFNWYARRRMQYARVKLYIRRRLLLEEL